MRNNATLNIQMALMMFFQYMMFAVWWVPLAAYLTQMDIGTVQKSLILSSMALGCIVSPITGMIADRYFQGQYVLAVTNFINALLLALAGTTSNPDLLFIFLLIAMIFYMPTWGLTSSIAMTHIATEKFARIRVFGSVGWVVSGGFSLIFVHLFNLNFDGTNLPFYCGAGVSLVAAISNIFLPKTISASKGQKVSVISAMGLGAVKLMKKSNFFWFIILSFLSMIPFSMYWSYCSEFLLDKGFKYISITMNLGQLAEMLFLLSVPFVVKKYGLRITMLLGLVALSIRYLGFYSGSVFDSGFMYIIGILMHGLIFGYFYLGGQMYIDKKAPKELKAQAQGFIFLVTFGLGLLVGNFVSGKIISVFSETGPDGTNYQWGIIWGITAAMSVALAVLFPILVTKEK
jgi:nucleoside transporter